VDKKAKLLALVKKLATTPRQKIRLVNGRVRTSS